ncbi:MAG: hypothetical protein ACTHMG_15365, partial [Sphingomonas sp.]
MDIEVEAARRAEPPREIQRNRARYKQRNRRERMLGQMLPGHDQELRGFHKRAAGEFAGVRDIAWCASALAFLYRRRH